MSLSNWNQRFFTSTRGQIITLLRRSGRTVDELAQALDLTDNAVRAHLTTLERDGFVIQRGLRRGSGKPSFVYELTPEAEYLFPKSYGQVLDQLLEVLDERMTVEELDDLLRAVGQRMAAKRNLPTGDLSVRLEAAVEVLNELGGMAELEIGEEAFCIRGYSCPLAAAVPGHPQVCHLAETLLTEVVGVPVKEQCDRNGTVKCRFWVEKLAS
jgi:predicted ArsR family transcriptional regulator